MIGKLKNEVSLLTEQRLADGGGGALVQWGPTETFLADVVWRRSALEQTGERRRFRRRARLTLRVREDLTFAMRLQIAGSPFAIVSIAELPGAGAFLAVDVEEVLP